MQDHEENQVSLDKLEQPDSVVNKVLKDRRDHQARLDNVVRMDSQVQQVHVENRELPDQTVSTISLPRVVPPG